jgi:hypothetical protein
MSADTTYPVTRAPIPTTIISELRPAEAKSHFALTIFKWYPLILTFSVVLTIVAAIAMLMKPIPPSATAKILIKTGSDALPISGLPVTSGRATPEFLQTEAEMFSSRLVLLPVVRALREQRGEPVVESELDTAVSALRADLVVSLIPNTTMLQTKKSAPTEAEAERLLRMIIDSYVEQHATAYSGGASFAAFFEPRRARRRHACRKPRTAFSSGERRTTSSRPRSSWPASSPPSPSTRRVSGGRRRTTRRPGPRSTSSPGTSRPCRGRRSRAANTWRIP